MYALHLVPCEPHVVLSLVLYKMVDSGPEVGRFFGLRTVKFTPS